MIRRQGSRLSRASATMLVLSLLALPWLQAQEATEEGAPATSESAPEVEFGVPARLLHQAGNSCYALANGLLGDPQRTTEGAQALTDYFEAHRDSVDGCGKACAAASETTLKTELADAEKADLLKRYAKAVADLCAAAMESADSVQIYGKKVSKASYEVALTESEIERKQGILLSKKSVEVEVDAESGAVASEEPTSDAVAEQTEMPAEPPKAPAQPATRKAEPAPPKISGDDPAPYWDDKRKQEQIQEAKRVEENQRIQEERDRIRREKRERQETERRESAMREMAKWYAVYTAGIENLRPAVRDFREVVQGRSSGRLVDICRTLVDESQLAIDNKALFDSPIDEVDSLLSSSIRDYRRMATDCLQGRTHKLSEKLSSADEKMGRVEELLKPYVGSN